VPPAPRIRGRLRSLKKAGTKLFDQVGVAGQSPNVAETRPADTFTTTRE